MQARLGKFQYFKVATRRDKSPGDFNKDCKQWIFVSLPGVLLLEFKIAIGRVL
jgi:hypothetical protein